MDIPQSDEVSRGTEVASIYLPDISAGTLEEVATKYCTESQPDGEGNEDKGLFAAAKEIGDSVGKARNARDAYLVKLVDTKREFVDTLANATGELEAEDAESYSTGVVSVIEAYDIESGGELAEKIRGMQPDLIKSKFRDLKEVFGSVSKGNPFGRALAAPRFSEDHKNLPVFADKLAGSHGPGGDSKIQMGARIGAEIVRRIGLPLKSSEQVPPPLPPLPPTGSQDTA